MVKMQVDRLVRQKNREDNNGRQKSKGEIDRKVVVVVC